YDIIDGRTATNQRIFAIVEPGEPDGFCVDEQGNVLSSSQEGVQIYSPVGTYLGKIPIPEVCANLTFGGENRDRLFITAGDSLYTIQLKTRGIGRP
ncbi:MAG: SMP-30/gluconolactonase/LRE family protein, partial [Cyanobacteria bacterium J06555_13]